MNWWNFYILFAQQTGVPQGLPTNPSDFVKGVNEGGAVWILGAVTIASVVLCAWLGRALLAAKDRAVEVEKAHGLEIATLYKSQLGVAEETKELLIKLNERWTSQRSLSETRRVDT